MSREMFSCNYFMFSVRYDKYEHLLVWYSLCRYSLVTPTKIDNRSITCSRCCRFSAATFSPCANFSFCLVCSRSRSVLSRLNFCSASRRHFTLRCDLTSLMLGTYSNFAGTLPVTKLANIPHRNINYNH